MSVRVGFDLTGLQLDTTGTARYILGLRDALRAHDEIALFPLEHRSRMRGVARALARETSWLPFRLPRKAAAMGLDVLHCPAPLAPIRSAVPVVLNIYDALPARHPQWVTRRNVVQNRLLLRPAARAAAVVCVPTEHARGDIVEALGLDLERTAVVPGGVGPGFTPGRPDEAVLRRLGVQQPYLLAVGTLQPRKNIEAALRAFVKLSDDGVPHNLVVAGARGWHDNELIALLRDPAVARRVITPGRVTEDELLMLYRGADCFIFPSRYEGFGLPPLEAMACGTPVIASDRTSIPEVVGDAAELVDPDDEAGLVSAVSRVLDPSHADDLRRRGFLRAGQYTWERAAAATVKAYRRAVG